MLGCYVGEAQSSWVKHHEEKLKRSKLPDATWVFDLLDNHAPTSDKYFSKAINNIFGGRAHSSSSVSGRGMEMTSGTNGGGGGQDEVEEETAGEGQWKEITQPSNSITPLTRMSSVDGSRGSVGKLDKFQFVLAILVQEGIVDRELHIDPLIKVHFKAIVIFSFSNNCANAFLLELQ